MKEGIIIIGHGSKLNFNKEIMELHAKRMREKGFKNVYIGFNEISLPSIEETLERMAADGVDTITALPLFIASGIHLTKDIPEKIGVPENGTRGSVKINGRMMKVKYATPIGDDPKITEILIEKVNSMK
ncbi:sirohydrochlorin cobaltochelatase [Candidatus Methanoplasma termitum]|uniref:CbiX1 protein n=1 Tax=Candidatus Methanoplasma termitum TaxID=1577791 RepID=A0A0A7LGJ4_9ARCH|nr:sirohydrochlorin nickelochelatase [Candidatus Methanoplasma termitum]AIZ56586.1 sirohydrochlorin cobaltochelatase [Candidatus Methanoplasma termitum]MCL2333833.1 sirohydrochlorin nickelochelatase [Candidatus Methanoplasma sp.]